MKTKPPYCSKSLGRWLRPNERIRSTDWMTATVNTTKLERIDHLFIPNSEVTNHGLITVFSDQVNTRSKDYPSFHFFRPSKAILTSHPNFTH